LVALRRRRFEIDFRSVPRQFAANYVAFQQRLAAKFRCILCGDDFTAKQSGTLLCAFHPLAEYANSQCATPYLGLAPSPCGTCNDQHLMSALRRRRIYHPRNGEDGITTHSFSTRESDVPVEAIPLQLNDVHGRIGCVAIDHCTSVSELFTQPYVALPLVYFSHLVLSMSIDPDHPAPVEHKRNWLVVSEAEQLVKMLTISVPYFKTPFAVPVMVVYEAMALKFGLESLADGARAARVWNNKSSLSQLKYLHHPDADRKDSLHKNAQLGVQFAPFIIIAKVAQNAFNSEGMRLV
jgi:hypothetical protein